MPANVPQTLEAVERLYQKLRREGFIRDGVAFRTGAHVQARVRRAVLCGRVLGQVAIGEEKQVRYAVATTIGDFFVRAFDLRVCGDKADGRCTCVEPDASAAGSTHGACLLPPLGNTGVNR